MKEEIKVKDNGNLYFEKQLPENLKGNIMFRVIIESGDFSLIKNIIEAVPNDIIKVNEKDYILENIEIIKNHLVFTIKEVL